jgi:hypothetical protein
MIHTDKRMSASLDPGSSMREGIQDTTPSLFATIPEGLFGPLASPNRQHYWRLLCRLFEEFFGPDAPLPPSIGFQRREITAALERYLLTDDPWEDDEGDAPDAALNVRANSIYERFRNAGWLRQERVGAREMVSMTPVVSQLLTTLIEFSERGPSYVGAKVRSIELQLRQILDGHAGGDSLDEAADQSRQLLSQVAAISVQVRDLIPELSKAETTAIFARKLFERYVGELFLGDYAELHNADHPLARRASILAMLREIEQSERREQLLHWYEEKATAGDRARAEHRLQRSLRRLQEIDRIDEYLGRLDDDIRLANRRALAFLDYRLRAPDTLDILLRRAARAVLKAPEDALRLPVATGGLMDESRLRAPRQRARAIPRTPNTAMAPTPEQIARLNLLKRMKRSRLVMAEDLSRYVDRYLNHAPEVNSENLTIESIEDFRAYQTLITLALRSRRIGGLRKDDPIHRLMRGFRIELRSGEHTIHPHLESPRFVLRKMRNPA